MRDVNSDLFSVALIEIKDTAQSDGCSGWFAEYAARWREWAEADRRLRGLRSEYDIAGALSS